MGINNLTSPTCPSYHKLYLSLDPVFEALLGCAWGCPQISGGHAAPLCPVLLTGLLDGCWTCFVPTNLPDTVDSQQLAPLPCSGIVGWTGGHNSPLAPGPEGAPALMAPGCGGQKCHLPHWSLTRAPQMPRVGREAAGKTKSAVL